MILVTGATGTVGRHVVTRLAERRVPVRALVRDPAKAERLPAGAEIVQGDLSDPGTLHHALEGVTAVFLFAVPGCGPGFVAAAEKAGVERVVFLSSGAVDDDGGPADQDNPIAAYHAEIEWALRDSGLGWTFLRSSHMATNALPWAAQTKAGDVVRAPYAGAFSAPVHEADLADCAVVALTAPGHTGHVYELTGPESLTAAEQVALVGAAIGRPLRYEELPPEVAREQMSRFVPPFILDTLFAGWEASVGVPAFVFPTVERITGRPARTFAQWATDHAADFA
ncbi:NAD(P)H-binding protein [Spirillospora sp. NPDC047279]|uniref:SDR family oxidoreductase n=1 Tax=Spirillospora sp. NPDC047279 TaxID=3155478 RepID=UPI0033C1D06F